MQQYKEKLLQELEQLQERKKKANDIQEIFYLYFEIGVREHQLKLIEKNTKEEKEEI